ncbi:hypothetical protein RHIZ404_210689 [Rhizobium sp. EC-SD404]|nr:hypothetical protein RHIZ404_210689 [Rhizobium sp. EC-SD404]
MGVCKAGYFLFFLCSMKAPPACQPSRFAAGMCLSTLLCENLHDLTDTALIDEGGCAASNLPILSTCHLAIP